MANNWSHSQIPGASYSSVLPMASRGWPVCLASSLFKSLLSLRISSAWMAMSVACPWGERRRDRLVVSFPDKGQLAHEQSHSQTTPTPALPCGWCIMILACGRQCLIPSLPAATRNAPMLQACPTHQVDTGAVMYCIVS